MWLNQYDRLPGERIMVRPWSAVVLPWLNTVSNVVVIYYGSDITMV